MSENRIVTELFLEKPCFSEVLKVGKALESAGIKTILMPSEDRGINTHMVVETADLTKVRKKLKEMGLSAIEKEVVLVRLDNTPGTMANATTKIAKHGVNLVYAFSVAMTPTMSYALFGATDNNAALKALES